MDQERRRLERFFLTDPERGDLVNQLSNLGRRAPQSNLDLLTEWFSSFKDLPPQNQKRMLAYLENLGSAASILTKPLFEALPSLNSELRKQARSLLRRIGEDKVSIWTEALKSDDPRLCRMAVQEVGALGPKALAAMPELKGVLEKGTPALRLLSIQAMVKVGKDDPAMFHSLIEYLDSSIPGIARVACIALGDRLDKAPEAFNVLLEVMVNHHSIPLRCEAIRSLKVLCRSYAASPEPFIDFIQNDPGWGECESENFLYTIREVTELLIEMGPEVVPALVPIALSQAPTSSREAALKILAAFPRTYDEALPQLFLAFEAETKIELLRAFFRLLQLNASHDCIAEQWPSFVLRLASEDPEVRVASLLLCHSILDHHDEVGDQPNAQFSEGSAQFIEQAQHFLKRGDMRAIVDPKRFFQRQGKIPCEQCLRWIEVEANVAYSRVRCHSCGHQFPVIAEYDYYSWEYSYYESDEPRRVRVPSNPKRNKAGDFKRPTSNSEGFKRFLASGRNPWLCSRRKDRVDWIQQILLHWNDELQEWLRRGDRHVWFAAPILASFLGHSHNDLAKNAYQALCSPTFDDCQGLNQNLEILVNKSERRPAINALRLLFRRASSRVLSMEQQALCQDALNSEELREACEALSLLFLGGHTVSLKRVQDFLKREENDDFAHEFLSAITVDSKRIKGSRRFLEGALEHSSRQIRLQAASLLGRSDLISNKSLPALRNALQHSPWTTRNRIAETLEKYGHSA